MTPLIENHPATTAGASCLGPAILPRADDDGHALERHHVTAVPRGGRPALTLSGAGELAAAADDDPCRRLVGQSPAMLDLHRRIRRVATTDATVLISGETGTGKELVARALHELGARRNGAFVALNCGAVSPSLIESELFGHERGSFTGANRLRHGVFAQAHGGTLFLDEVTEMTPELQVRLLRVLETGSFQRLGGECNVTTDARIVAATNRDPLAAVRAGQLRSDLYYRLHVVPIEVPPLRDRANDIELLARHFLDAHNQRHGTRKVFTSSGIRRVQAHAWPGNVRELEHYVHHAFVMTDRAIDASDLPDGPNVRSTPGRVEVAIGSSLAAAERQVIVATLADCQGNKTAAAAVLGISLKTLYCRLNVYAALATDQSA